MELKRASSLFSTFIQNAHDDLDQYLISVNSKSSHNLVAVDNNHNSRHRTIRRLKSAVELCSVEEKCAFDLSDTPLTIQNATREEYDNRPVLRRKRFTRRQRKSFTIKPEIGLILAKGPRSSSDEEDARSKSISRGVYSHRELSTSVSALPKEDSILDKKSTNQPKGPAARRASRRTALKLKLNNAVSTSNLDQIQGSMLSKRSLSVRDLNGEEFDFSNKDSVTRWTSQILAEIESLPSSCVDLTQVEKPRSVKSVLYEDNRKYSTIQSPSIAPPVPPHRKSFFTPNNRMTKSEIMTTSTPEMISHLSSMTSSPLDSVTTLLHKTRSFVDQSPKSFDGRILSTDSLNSSLDDLLPYVYARSERSSTLTKDEESLINVSVVYSPANSEVETPLAVTPIPFEEISASTKSDLIGLKRNSSPVQIQSRMKEPSIRTNRLATQDKLKEISKVQTSINLLPNSSESNMRKENTTGNYRQNDGVSEAATEKLHIPEPRPCYPIKQAQTNNDDESRPIKENSEKNVRYTRVKFRNSHSNILATIGNSNSVYGDAKNTESVDPQVNRLCVPSLATGKLNSEVAKSGSGDEILSKWKERAQCRSKIEPTESEEPRSVNRVVASLIKTIEDSRLTAPDRPTVLNIDQVGQDVGTQTSPFSISRSSSFDWINDPTERALRELKTPISTPRSDHLHLPTGSKVESSSETDDADREVAEMTKFSNIGKNDEAQGRGKPIRHDKLFAEMEESIAMLLEYGQQHIPKPLPRKMQSREKSIDSNSPTFSTGTNSCKLNSDSLPSDLRKSLVHQSSVGGSAPVMTESIYDNMPKDKRKKSQEPQCPLTKPLLLPRELSVGSLITDSGSAPLTPDQSLNSVETNKSFEAINRLIGNHVAMGLPSYTTRDRAGSCELLAEYDNGCDENLKAKLKNAEEDALESCHWLRKAGFPQYAKQYEEGQFPIDIRGVQRDHEFLGQDSLKALYRRLNTLNRCAIMKIDNVVLRRRNEDYSYNDMMYGAIDDDDNVALSGNWHYQRHSHTWSRIGNEQMYGAPGRRVSTKPNWDTFREPLERSPYEVREANNPYGEHRSDRRLERYEENERRTDYNGNEAQANGKLQRSQSERIKERARAIMKKMDLRSSSRRRKESRHRDPSTMIIGDPILVSYDSASPEAMRMFPKGIRPTALEARGRQLIAERQPRSKSARRQGMVLLSPSSPESSSTDDSFRSSISLQRRDRSMPPRALERVPLYIRDYKQPFSPCERFRRERNQYDSYLYPAGHTSLTRVPPRNSSRVPGVSSCRYENSNYYGSPGYSIPAYNSSYGARSYHTPPTERTRNLIIQPDGYYLHEMSPDLSMSRVRQLQRSGSPSTSNGITQLRVDTHGNKSQSSLDNTDEEQSSSNATANHNRRDSGVGSSLSRSPSGPSAQRIRQSVLPYTLALSSSLISSSNNSSIGSWQAAKRRLPDRTVMTSSLSSSVSTDETFFTDVQMVRCVDSLSVVELTRLHKLAYLRVTAILEKHMGPGSTVKIGEVSAANGSTCKNWTVQKLIKKIKHMDGKNGKECEEGSVFGQPLDVIYKKTGQCLPRTILEILRFLRQMAPDTVGIFRKNGVKSRISELRSVCDKDAETDVFVNENRLDPGQVHDVADMLKQYLRELPEPLMTSKLSETFTNIFLHVPEAERLTAVQYAILLLPDEHREALQTLLFFLNDIAKHSEFNNMPAQNLSVCFTPSLFQLSASRLDKITPTRRHKTIGASGMPTEREMRETRAAQQCLTQMIQNCKLIFVVPETTADDRSECEEDAPILKELGSKGPRSYLVDKVLDMVKEHADRWKGWIVEGSCEGVEISCKKPADSHPLKMFRVWVDVAAPPKEVMVRLMKERNLCDASVLNWRTIDIIHAPDMDLHQYVLNDTIGHPTRDCFVVRFHRSDLSEIRGACAIAERSVQCSETQLLGGISAAVLDSRFLIEPKAGHSRVTHIARVDLRGRCSSWYNKVYGNILARKMSRLRDSFQQPGEDHGPETKV